MRSAYVFVSLSAGFSVFVSGGGTCPPVGRAPGEARYIKRSPHQSVQIPSHIVASDHVEGDGEDCLRGDSEEPLQE